MAIYISKQSGLWSSASTWLTGTPSATYSQNASIEAIGDAGLPPQSGDNDRIIIRGNHIVEYDVQGSFGNGSTGNITSDVSLLNTCAIILSAGTLKASRSQTTSLTVNGQIGIHYNGCWFDWGTQTDPIPSNISSTIIFGLPTDATANRSGFRSFNSTAPDSRTQYNKVTICGSAKTRNTQLANFHSSGTTVLSVLDCTNWVVGDRVIVEIPPTPAPFTSVPANTIAFITDINGNEVTISTGLLSNCVSGVCVGNFSSNVTLKPGMATVGALNTNCNAFGFIINPNGLGPNNEISTYEFRNISLENFAGATVFRFGFVYARKDVILDNFSYYIDPSITTNYNAIASWQAGTGYNHTISNFAVYGNQSVETKFNASNYASYTISDGVFYRVGTAFDLNGHRSVTIKNVRLTSGFPIFGAQINGQLANISDSIFRTNSGFVNQPSIGIVKFSYLNCTFVGNSNTVFNTSAGAEAHTGIYELRNCTLSSVKPEIQASASGSAAKTLAINSYNTNNNILDNRRSNSFYYLSGNNTVRNRGLASYDWVSRKTNIPYFFTENIPAKANISQRFIGYIKYDSIYGNANLPYLTFTDETNTSSVTQTFSCSNDPDVWQKFDLTVTPVIDGNLIMTVYTQTSSSVARVYFDGMAFDPIIPKTRHYGFVFNDTFPNRIVDSKLTLSESEVSLYPVVYDLNYLYDEGAYWSVTNPTLTSYIDITVPDGTKLDAADNNIVLDNNYSTNFEYLSATKTLTLKTLSLSSSSNFNTIKTTGNIYLSGASYIKNMNVEGTVFVNTPQNLENTDITNVRYNVNSNTNITYKNCIVNDVQNSGSGTLTITLDNSTVNSSSGNVTLLVNPTILNITNLDGGYISVFDNTGTLRFYQNTNEQIPLPAGSSGTWSYKIAKYNYKAVEGTFTVNPLNGTTITLEPIYSFDSFVSETNVSVTSAYSVFNDLQQVYDYLSYFRTTSAGLSGIPTNDFYAYRNVLDVVNNKIVFDPAAPSSFAYDYINRTLTLSSQKMTAGSIIKGLETLNSIYLSGSHSLSGMYATIGDSIYVSTPSDLKSFNLLNSGTIKYNTDVPISLVYTDSDIFRVQNDGTGMVTITRFNSFIRNETDDEVQSVVPITINVDLPDDAYIAIYKPGVGGERGPRYRYLSGNSTIVLGGDAVTGAWSYRVTRYGYAPVVGTFSIDADVSSTTNISPLLGIDSSVTQTDVSTVSAYTNLETTSKIYDYYAYYITTSEGIDSPIVMSRTIGVLTFDGYSVELNAAAPAVFDYQPAPTSKLTIKCTSLNERVDIYCDGDFSQTNANTISKDVRVRASNIDSEIEFIGINAITFYPSLSDRNNNTSAGPSTTSDIYRFKLGNTYSGVLFSGDLYIRADVGSLVLQTLTLNSNPGYNVLDLGTFGQLQQVLLTQRLINRGVKKSSRLIPHSEDI